MTTDLASAVAGAQAEDRPAGQAVVLLSDGIHNAGGSVILNGTSSISHNTSGGAGGGITNLDGSVTLNDSATVSDNTASAGGGGIFSFATVPVSVSVTLNGTSSISGNTAGGRGGGINSSNIAGAPASVTVTMNDSATISGNTADFDGGGIGNFFGTVTMTGVTNLHYDEKRQDRPDRHRSRPLLGGDSQCRVEEIAVVEFRPAHRFRIYVLE